MLHHHGNRCHGTRSQQEQVYHMNNLQIFQGMPHWIPQLIKYTKPMNLINQQLQIL